MPSIFFLSPFQPPVWDGKTDLHIEPESYIAALKVRWNVEHLVQNPSGSTYIVSWNLNDKTGNKIEGGLQVGNKVVSVQGDADSIATFTIWHKNTVSRDQLLYLFDEGLHINFPIEQKTQIQDITKVIGGTLE